MMPVFQARDITIGMIVNAWLAELHEARAQGHDVDSPRVLQLEQDARSFIEDLKPFIQIKRELPALKSV